MINIILCGGVGERLWPISRTRYPKQFSRIIEGKSLLQHTVLRNRNACDKTIIVTNTEQYFMARDQLEEIGCTASFVLESVGRNTAPAMALACLGLTDDELILVTPADHLILDLPAYEEALKEGILLAETGAIVTFGIHPEWPETGYGYIHAEGSTVLAFKEKPDVITAQEYVSSGHFYWNSGIFLFHAGVFLSELSFWQPDVLDACRFAMMDVEKGADFVRVREAAMMGIPKISVDYAVMEKSHLIRMVASDISWSDLGSFEALHDALPEDENGNVMISGVDAGSTKNVNGMEGLASTRVIGTTAIKKAEDTDLTNAHVTGTVAIKMAEDAALTSAHVTGTVPEKTREKAYSKTSLNGIAGTAAVLDSDHFINIGSSNNFIYSESKKVAVIDVADLMIVDTRDALLVGLRSSSQKVKEVVEVLKAEGSRLKDYHVTEFRPWGHYTSLQEGYRYKMRSMTVKPGHKLGNHRHFNRNEHWVVVNGTAEMEVGTEVRMISENQSTYIPAGHFHRIGNPGRVPLVMIEVQSGAYLEEDDIERLI